MYSRYTNVMHRRQGTRGRYRAFFVLFALYGLLSFTRTAQASPFGQGVFGANVPFGSLTSLTIALGGNPSINLTPSGATFVGSGTHTITVTSTDAVGYNLYIYAASGTSMTNGASTIAASSNGTPAPLSLNTWGYNIDGSSNYTGITTRPTLLKSAAGPYKSGDNTTVTYGALTSSTAPAGSYSVSVTYTAVAMNE